MTIGYGSYGSDTEANGVKVVVAKLDLSLGSNVGIAFDVQDKAFPVVKEVLLLKAIGYRHVNILKRSSQSQLQVDVSCGKVS